MDEKERQLQIDLLMARIRDRAIAETRRLPNNAGSPCECGARPGELHDPLCKRFYRERTAREQELHQTDIQRRYRSLS